MAFLVPMKLTTTTVGVGIQKNLQNKPKNNNKYFWVIAIRVLALAGSHCPPYLPRMPSNTLLIAGPAVGAAQTLIRSCSWCSGLQCPQLSDLVHCLLSELSVAFYIFHTHRVRLVDHVNLICSLYSWWEGFGSSSLAALPLGFNCGFIPPLRGGHPLGFI